jgi:hypothetical protein
LNGEVDSAPVSYGSLAPVHVGALSDVWVGPYSRCLQRRRSCRNVQRHLGALARVGIHRNDPSTWTTERPEHLQHLKNHPAFLAVGGGRTIEAINEVMEGQSWQKPRDWGAFFLQFPIGREWDIPSTGWHLDGDYAGRLSPACGVHVHAMLTDVGPRCGGVNVLRGSHRLVHRWFSGNPPPPGTRGAQFRESLARHPYLRDLCTAGNPEARIARFHTPPGR